MLQTCPLDARTSDEGPRHVSKKMSDKDLTAYIGSVCPRKIDFLYLRRTYCASLRQNSEKNGRLEILGVAHHINIGTNAGTFFFGSESLQMSYANYQGKATWLEIFQNPCVKRLAGQPKIFYSDGPEQGLPESFPVSTHLRRKERSPYSRRHTERRSTCTTL
ncbi:hypothetical protein K438DRAFT_1582512 [Mycena galopus ATCC 62051]|nr:hypothetical protein K438DRAFT_1582512 [Mycena galopus ATCC 62051]